MGKVSVTRDRLVAALGSVEPNSWVQAVVHESPTRWLPLVEVTTTRLWLGLDAAGRWTIGRKGGAVTLDNSLGSPSWLPLLEQRREELDRKVAEIAEEMSLPVAFSDFPVRQLIVSGLMSGRNVWVGSALDWLEFEQGISEYRDALAVAANSRGAGQKNRQRAWRRLSERFH
jgi:hypothetical protein